LASPDVGAAGLGATGGDFCPMTGGRPAADGRTGTCGRVGAAPGAGRSGLGLPREAMNSRSLTTSSSVRLASAEPLSWMPARVQISTSSLLSSLSSFASV